MLDEAELEDALIVASNDLDEYEIESLRARGARIDVWGVGTRLATAYDQPALGGVYKLSAFRHEEGRWEPKLKLSEQPIKVSTPGILQTRRFRHQGHYRGDIVYDLLTGIAEPAAVTIDDQSSLFQVPADAHAEDLLVPVFRGGELVYHFPSLFDSRQRCLHQLAEFGEQLYDPRRHARYRVGLERTLHETKSRMASAAGEARP